MRIIVDRDKEAEGVRSGIDMKADNMSIRRERERGKRESEYEKDSGNR